MQSIEEAMQDQKEVIKITAKAFGARFRDKSENVNFLRGDVGAYLPPTHW